MTDPKCFFCHQPLPESDPDRARIAAYCMGLAGGQHVLTRTAQVQSFCTPHRAMIVECMLHVMKESGCTF